MLKYFLKISCFNFYLWGKVKQKGLELQWADKNCKGHKIKLLQHVDYINKL